MSVAAAGLTLLAVIAMCVFVGRAQQQAAQTTEGPVAQTTAGPVAQTERPPVWPFLLAVILPIIGFVPGAIEAAKRSTGRGAAIMALSLVAGFVWYSLVVSASGHDKCVVVASGGNKLCGDDARAWCDSTDPLRDAANDPESQRICDEVRR